MYLLIITNYNVPENQLQYIVPSIPQELICILLLLLDFRQCWLFLFLFNMIALYVSSIYDHTILLSNTLVWKTLLI